MSESNLNPSQHVERIREILIGKKMGQVEKRLGELESRASVFYASDPQLEHQLLQTQQSLMEETRTLRAHIQEEAAIRQQQFARLAGAMKSPPSVPVSSPFSIPESSNQSRERIEAIAAEMSSRIDARTHEILQHLQGEIVKWKNQLDSDLQTLRESKADRVELQERLNRIAQAAFADSSPETSGDGYVL